MVYSLHLCMEFKTIELVEIKNRLVVARSMEWGEETDEGGQKV